MNSESMEMYLETVYLLEEEHGHAHCADIAIKMGVSKPSVTKAMKQLKIKGYINKETYGTITLTKVGSQVSKQIYSRHNLITDYLIKTLNIKYDEASLNACKIEHVISETMFEAIKTYLKYGGENGEHVNEK